VNAQPVQTEYDIIHPRPEAVVVALLGEHDLVTKGEMSALFADLIEANDLVVVDVSEARFIDSSFIHIFLVADRMARSLRKRFRLQLGTAPIVRRALEVSGALDVLDVATTRAEALAT
jgi:anti-anti-sigma factor